MTTTKSESFGRITDEAIERFRSKLDVPYGRPKPPHNLEAHADTIRHFAWAYGDDNPLYNDPSYGDATRWGGMIAPPLYLLTMGEDEVGPLPADVRARSKGALAGVHLFNSGTEIQFYRPIRPGDRIAETVRLVDVQEKVSRFGGGKSVISYNEHTYQNRETREVYAVRLSWYVHTERESSRKANREGTIQPPSYDAEQIEEITAKVLAEKPRGADPRWWEDVAVGDVVGPLHKGPLTLSDVVCFHIGLGTGGDYGWGPLRLAAKRRQEMPGFYTRNAYGAWDVVQRVHWDEEWARSIGAQRPYDYGQTRQMWLAHLLTDWMGDDGWLSSLRLELRRFNYIGDLSTVQGTVVEKPRPGVVRIALSIVNQDEVETTKGEATVFLPTREQPQPELPVPPAVPESVARAQRERGRAADRKRP
ncbi:acyl dehydratase [Amycolatopsis bartoniae]|uniref:Acyl dehydratase n=1 Tax=Amycolatopsis bartoniae TaxID=941986 RepID=A0A8H9INL6_9PSEU|nr:MaoC family dehydratase N-terminal domain-containing protein [Amycolatopsis bartoniae]MBB2939715.1 acyl dehydratase [Amycolatopsis bartoniae]GHF36308.1 acyl dehydratase [Amycolatopsis bartoniae]